MTGVWVGNVQIRTDYRYVCNLALVNLVVPQMKPYNIYVTLAFPPDTDTPGLVEENKTKVNVAYTWDPFHIYQFVWFLLNTFFISASGNQINL